MKVDKKAVGQRIRNIRIELGLTLNEFAEKVDGTKSDIERAGRVHMWENGYNLPNSKRLKVIAKIAGITVDELLYGQQANFNKYQERLLEEMKLNLAPKNLIINSVSMIESEEVMNRLSGEEVCEVIEEYAKWWRNEG